MASHSTAISMVPPIVSLPKNPLLSRKNWVLILSWHFDECAEPHDRKYNERSMKRTHVWADRCLRAKSRSDQALFGIVQGGVFPDFREESATFISSLDFPGLAIGGLSVGESKKDMHAMIKVVNSILPEDKPRYLMGVGSPEDLINGILRGCRYIRLCSSDPPGTSFCGFFLSGTNQPDEYHLYA